MDTRTRNAREALRKIPSLDAFARSDAFAEVARPLLLRTCREYLDALRERVLGGELNVDDVTSLFDGGAAEQQVVALCAREGEAHHRRVINATGIVLHTGIGRAPMARAAVDAVAQAAGYAIVELDPESGERNQREVAVAGLLSEITGATGALVVNNNAAAVTLALAAVARGREVVVSRGQLVEIGGGFRMPDVMAQAGCHMVEVGTTNRTHVADFERAIGEQTAALLLVHPSNFRVLGFTGMPSRAELVMLGRQHGVPVIDDLGSGLLVPAGVPGLEAEPRVAEAIDDEVDLVCFSGDKLLGGPQAGIVLGDKELVAKVRRHPLYRAMRCDKTILAALEATLRVYRDGDPLREIPTLRAISAAPEHLRARADQLGEKLGDVAGRVVPSESFAGSGANPARALPSFAVAIAGGDAVAARLRAPGALPAVFARIEKDEVLLDLRTLEVEDLDEVARVVRERLSS